MGLPDSRAPRMYAKSTTSPAATRSRLDRTGAVQARRRSHLQHPGVSVLTLKVHTFLDGERLTGRRPWRGGPNPQLGASGSV